MIKHFTLNTVAALEVVQAAAPLLEKTKGSVVLFSSIAARQGFKNHATIAAAKGAVESLTLQMAAELAPAVRVNCIAPSLTNTSLAQNIATKAAQASYGSAHPLKRIGEPEDVAAMAAFLLGPDATWITGQIIGVDGGRSTIPTALPGRN